MGWRHDTKKLWFIVMDEIETESYSKRPISIDIESYDLKYTIKNRFKDAAGLDDKLDVRLYEIDKDGDRQCKEFHYDCLESNQKDKPYELVKSKSP